MALGKRLHWKDLLLLLMLLLLRHRRHSQRVHDSGSGLQAPSFTVNPHNKDVYSAYNKPEAVIDWLAHNEVGSRAPRACACQGHDSAA